MTTLVIVDSSKGDLDRYECGGTHVRKTHSCTAERVVTFTIKAVEGFRLDPPEWSAVGSAPEPTEAA